MFKGSLMAVDVGGGTQDIFIWEPGQTVENGVKLVLPAPTQVLARRIKRLTAQGQPIFLQGRVMGGGAVTQAQLTTIQTQADQIHQQLESQHLATALQVRALLTPAQLAQSAQTHAQLDSLHPQERAIYQAAHPAAPAP